MKNILLISLLVMCLASCKKKTASPSTETSSSQQDEELKYSGNFSNGPYGTVSGKASVYLKSDNTYEVRFNDFSSSAGPKLHVVLSKYSTPSNYIDLGKLKSTNGNQTYTVSGMPDFKEYKYVFVHCLAYNHLFGTAIIQ